MQLSDYEQDTYGEMVLALDPARSLSKKFAREAVFLVMSVKKFPAFEAERNPLKSFVSNIFVLEVLLLLRNPAILSYVFKIYIVYRLLLVF